MSEENPILDALAVSLILNRKDKTGQVAWTEWRDPIVLVGGTPAQAGNLALLGPNGQFDPSVIPGGSGGSTVSVNGVLVTDPNFNGTLPSAPNGFTNVIWQSDGAGNVSAYYATSGSVPSFAVITTGDNTSAQMTVSGTATLQYSGTGVVNANEIGGINVAGNVPTHVGQLLISQPGNTTAVWADPLMQGLYAAGSSIASPPAFVAPTTIQPILVGAADPSGNLQNLNEDALGNLKVTGTVAISGGTIAVTQSTSPWVVSGTVAISNFPTTQAIVGTLTHNAAAPTNNNLGVLPAVASSASPTYNNNDAVMLSTDLAGNLRTTGTSTVAPISSAGNAPLQIAVPTSSTLVLASNPLRKGCNLTNMSIDTISLAFGSNPAQVYFGLVLGPGGTFWMDLQDFTTAAINAISDGANGFLAVQEFV